MSDAPVILLCPGQGAQLPGMGKAWAESSAAAAAVFQRADDVLGLSLSKVCFEGPQDQLNRTDIAQAALYVTAVASFRGLCEAGAIDPSRVVAAAGLSLGEFTALHLAGAFDFETGLKLVRLRGQAMQAAADAVPGGSGMVALVGAEEARAEELCEKARGGQVLVCANFNCPGQVVLSGHRAACERALKEADSMGLRATALQVAGAFHSPLMQPAADRLAEALRAVKWQRLSMLVVSNVTARPHEASDSSSVSRLLVEQLTRPVRWAQSMAWLTKENPGRYVELAPNKVLSGLMRRIDRGVRVETGDAPHVARA